MRKRTLPVLLVGLFLSMVACNHFDKLDGIEPVDTEAEFAVPLINTSFTLQSLLQNLDQYTFLEVDPDGLIHLRYRGDVLTRTSQDIFASIAAAAGAFVVDSSPWPIPLESEEGVEIDYIEVATGNMVYTLGNYEEDPIWVTVTFPQMKDADGQTVQREHYLPAASPGDTTYLIPQTLDMADYVISAAADGNVYVEYEATNAVTDESVEVGGFLIVLSNLTFAYAEGYFANQLHDGERDTIEIEFFENWTRGDVYFEDPSITIEVRNSFGVPTRSIAEVFEIQTATGELLTLESPFITTGIDFDFPSLDEVGEIKTTYFTFDTTNSNIAEVLGAQPVAVDYDVDAITNPDNDTDIRGFIAENSEYTVSVEVDLPLFGSAADFIVNDTFDLSFDGFDDVEAVEFKLITENGLPLDVNLQAYFIDGEGATLDSLMAEPTDLIAAAPVDNEGLVVAPNEQTFFIPFPAERFDQIRSGEKLLLRANFATYNDGEVSVKILDSQEVQVKMGMSLVRSPN